MIDFSGTWCRFMAGLAFSKPSMQPNSPAAPCNASRLDALAARALTTVFGMDADGWIRKEKARSVVERLGLIGGGGDKTSDTSFEFFGGSDELRAEEVLGEEDDLRQAELMRQAFGVFDEDGDGFIDAGEVKRVLECLGLGSGWEMGEIQRMVEMVDLNLDGKVDFREFELMMIEN